MFFWKSNRKKSSSIYQKRLRLEKLEDKRLLAIVWANEFGTTAAGNDPNFGVFNTNEVVARTIVNRAIDDWEAVVQSFNYDSTNLNDTFSVNISAGTLTGGTLALTNGFATEVSSGIPAAANITIDDDAAGNAWYFDSTPLDDSEFTGIANAFQTSFVDVTASVQLDLYRVLAHEIGHAIGFTATYPLFDANLTTIDDPASNISTDVLRTYDGQNGLTATLTAPNNGTHFYFGDPNDPQGFLSHPNELMNTGLEIPAGTQPETTRQFVSDLTAQLLADAYGYTVTLPSTLNSAHVMLDNITGTLLIQGSARDNTTGVGLNDTFNIASSPESVGEIWFG